MSIPDKVLETFISRLPIDDVSTIRQALEEADYRTKSEREFSVYFTSLSGMVLLYVCDHNFHAPGVAFGVVVYLLVAAAIDIMREAC